MKKLEPFKFFCLQNFPFIEEDFDALTNYELMCKIVEYVNKNIEKTNELGTEVQNLINWFNNLDLQEEVNQKLDDMATSGELAEIINQEIFEELNSRVTGLENPFEKMIIIGDSYSTGYFGSASNTIKSWSAYLIELLNITNYYKFDENGAGFVNIGDNGHTFLTLLQNNINQITNRNDVKKIVICGGYNDRNYYKSNITNAINSFIEYCEEQFPNAQIYIGMISNSSENNATGTNKRFYIINNVLIPYKSSKAIYLNGVENILKNYSYFTDLTDTTHPNADGQKALGYGIYKSLISGDFTSYYDFDEQTMSITNSNIGSAQDYQWLTIVKKNDITFIYFAITTFEFTETVNLDNNYELNIGKLTHEKFRPCVSGINAWNCTFTVGYYDSNNDLKYTFCNGFVRIDENGNLIFRVFPQDLVTGNIYNLENIKNIRITSNTITTPTLLT